MVSEMQYESVNEKIPQFRNLQGPVLIFTTAYKWHKNHKIGPVDAEILWLNH